ncbi:DUF2442 domain-containing protein [Fibrella forsythiae]|uniref:DUF2442 domain-containing protein n=1 Tax=Fibrella forsythiae TaxID=2817061 RepID=A0ABS3JFY4_9BACT|nr:DUF2442 domain-containing protein [Fibrella forsythiae]MBO0948890.1 DUF2442 domain-containing protein [Fibrella forsythiae]
MIHSSALGGKPSVSSRLLNFLEGSETSINAELPFQRIEDDFDRLIQRENLRIVRFVWIRELDLALVVLNNRRIISQSLSAYSSLHAASDDDLAAYTISTSGIHWPNIDIDLSLRGLLMDEVVRSITVV